ALAVDTSCEQVRDVFVRDPALFAMPVVDGECRPVGLVNRFKFLERLSRPFGRELIVNKPVGAFMETDPLILDTSADSDVVGARLVDSGQRYVFDGFIVTHNGCYIGLATVLDLVRALTERRHAELERLALHDLLTGLPNRALFEQTLEKAIADVSPQRSV